MGLIDVIKKLGSGKMTERLDAVKSGIYAENGKLEEIGKALDESLNHPTITTTVTLPTDKKVG